MNWYKIEGEILNNSEEFGGIDSCLEVDICLKLEKHSEIPKQDFKPRILAFDKTLLYLCSINIFKRNSMNLKEQIASDFMIAYKAKEMEKKFWADLQERLDEIKQNPLPYKYQAPELVWKSLRKATEKDFDHSLCCYLICTGGR